MLPIATLAIQLKNFSFGYMRIAFDSLFSFAVRLLLLMLLLVRVFLLILALAHRFNFQLVLNVSQNINHNWLMKLLKSVCLIAFESLLRGKMSIAGQLRKTMLMHSDMYNYRFTLWPLWKIRNINFNGNFAVAMASAWKYSNNNKKKRYMKFVVNFMACKLCMASPWTLPDDMRKYAL